MLVHGKFGWSLSAIAKLYVVEPHHLIKTVGTLLHGQNDCFTVGTFIHIVSVF